MLHVLGVIEMDLEQGGTEGEPVTVMQGRGAAQDLPVDGDWGLARGFDRGNGSIKKDPGMPSDHVRPFKDNGIGAIAANNVLIVRC
jgi:hypothetical protein